MKALIVDMHVHSKFSDGTEEIDNIFKKAKEARLGLLCLTDHDTILGCQKALECGKEHSLKTLTGIEISTFKPDTQTFPVHILGYGINLENKKRVADLNEAMKQNYEYYEFMAEWMLQEYIKLGLLDPETSLESIKAKLGVVSPVIHRMHLMQVRAIKAGITIKQARQEAYKLELLKYPMMNMLDAFQAVELISALGGKSVLAHPGETLTYTTESNLTKLVELLVQRGLYGIEVYSGKHKSTDVMHFKKIASHYRLRVTAGSDFHGHENMLGIYGLTRKEFNEFMEGI